MHYNIPTSFTEALQQQITDQYKIILRNRALKNDAMEVSERERLQKEIDLRLENIEEIKRDFLGQVQNSGSEISGADLQLIVQDIAHQVMVGLEKEKQSTNKTEPNTKVTDQLSENEEPLDKPQILALIYRDVYKAVEELEKIFPDKHYQYSMLVGLRNELLDPPNNFQMSTFQARLKLFINTYL